MDGGERRPLTSARKVTSQILQPSFLSRKYTENWEITMRTDIRMRKTRAKHQISDNDKESENSYGGGGGEWGSILKLAVEVHQWWHQSSKLQLRLLFFCCLQLELVMLGSPVWAAQCGSIAGCTATKKAGPVTSTYTKLAAMLFGFCRNRSLLQPKRIHQNHLLDDAYSHSSWIP